MLSNERQRRICTKYSARDHEGLVHCNECPLVISVAWCMCHANSHYDPNECEFVPDDPPAQHVNYPYEPMYEEETL